MRFVDGDERDRHTDGEVAESFGFQTFRRHVQQFDLAGERLREDEILFVRRLSGVDERGRKATSFRASTWSRMSEINGEMTMATPGRIAAGI